MLGRNYSSFSKFQYTFVFISARLVNLIKIKKYFHHFIFSILKHRKSKMLDKTENRKILHNAGICINYIFYAIKFRGSLLTFNLSRLIRQKKKCSTTLRKVVIQSVSCISYF